MLLNYQAIGLALWPRGTVSSKAGTIGGLALVILGFPALLLIFSESVNTSLVPGMRLLLMTLIVLLIVLLLALLQLLLGLPWVLQTISVPPQLVLSFTLSWVKLATLALLAEPFLLGGLSFGHIIIKVS